MRLFFPKLGLQSWRLKVTSGWLEMCMTPVSPCSWNVLFWAQGHSAEATAIKHRGSHLGYYL